MAKSNVALKSIRSTYLYSMINKGGVMDDIMKTFISKGIVADKNMLETQYNTINSYYKYPLKISVMKAVDEGIIVPMMYPKGITANHKVPINMPFILVPSNASIKAIAVIDNYASIDEKNHNRIMIDPNKLYCLLESAFVARGLQLGFSSVRHNTILYTEGCSIYAHMFTKVLNKDYALNVKKDAYNKVVFLAAKFFMINLLQMEDSDLVFNYAFKTAKDLSPIIAKQLNDAFKIEDYTDISTFIQALAKNAYMIINGLENLTVREYITNFIKMYSNAGLFGLEHISYFIFNILSCLDHAYFNNQYAFDNAIGTKSADKIYAYLYTQLSRY